MTTYKIEIQEHLSRVIEIEAPSTEEAIDKAERCIGQKRLCWMRMIGWGRR